MWIWLQSYKIFFKEVLIWQTLIRYSAHFPIKWIKMLCMSSAWIINQRCLTAYYRLRGTTSVQTSPFHPLFIRCKATLWRCNFCPSLLSRLYKQPKKLQNQPLNNLNEMLNLIWLFNPNFVLQSCRTSPDCNYIFLYLSILYLLRY